MHPPRARFSPGPFVLAAVLALQLLTFPSCADDNSPTSGDHRTGSGGASNVDPVTRGEGGEGEPSGGGATAFEGTAPKLESLTLSHGALIPSFDPERTTYTWRIVADGEPVTLTPESPEGTIVTFEDEVLKEGSQSPALDVPELEATSEVVLRVTSEDTGEETTYTLTLKQVPQASSTKIYAIGDSTMAHYHPAMYPDQRGWGQELPRFLSPDIDFDNRALNGTSTKSYQTSGQWAVIKTLLRVGDTLLIQFGHNDEKDSGIEGDSGRGTAAWEGYHENLVRYVSEARALGAQPVLLTPVVRLGWSGDELSASVKHDLTGNGVAEGDANYPAAMRDVALTLDCPLIDMTQSTEELVESYGPAAAKEALYIETDNTHLSAYGAFRFAHLAAQGLADEGLFGGAIALGAHLAVEPFDLTFESTAVSSSSTQVVRIFGLGLAPEQPALTLSASDSFGLSLEEGAPSAATVELALFQGDLWSREVFLQFLPQEAGEISGQIVAADGSLDFPFPVQGVGVLPD